MSYSTTLYAIDLNRLKASIGSKDRKLLRAVEKLDESEPLVSHQRRQHWIAILEDGTILLDRSKSTFEEVTKLYSTLGRLDLVHCLGRHTDTVKRLYVAMGDITTQRKGDAANIYGHGITMDLEEFHAYDANAKIITTPDPQVLAAAAALVQGKPSDDIPLSYYGYALQQICRVLGRRLEDEDLIGEIAPLELKTRLAAPREIEGVPSDGDFPVVSFLTESEVIEESKKIKAKGIKYPKDSDIEAGRKALLRCLEDAAAQREAVVAFYY